MGGDGVDGRQVVDHLEHPAKLSHIHKTGCKGDKYLIGDAERLPEDRIVIAPRRAAGVNHDVGVVTGDLPDSPAQVTSRPLHHGRREPVPCFF